MAGIDSSVLLQQAIYHHRNGAISAAESLYKAVLKANPNQPTAAYNLALLEAEAGKFRAAQATLQRLLKMHPNDGSAHYSLAKLLERDGHLTKVLFHLRRAVELMPEQLDAYLDLIRGYGVAKQIEDARYVAQLAAQRFPDQGEVSLQLGVVLAEADHTEEAKHLFAAALDLNPNLPVALYNLARISDAQGEPGKSLRLYREARAADHDSKLPETNIGDLELKIGAVDAAIRSHETWLSRHPSDADVLSNRLLAAQYETGMTAENLLQKHKEWDTRIGQALRPPVRKRLAELSEVDRRLRVGLVSGDLREHPVGYFTIRAVESLDASEIELIAYSENTTDDPIARRFKRCVPRWRDTFGWSDARLASEIERDTVDILIDLAGHTSPSRLGIFARRPAALQITWAGYPGTTGLSTIDALIADRFVVPPGEDQYYVEKVLRLPDGFVCFDPPMDAPAVSPPPRELRPPDARKLSQSGQGE